MKKSALNKLLRMEARKAGKEMQKTIESIIGSHRHPNTNRWRKGIEDPVFEVSDLMVATEDEYGDWDYTSVSKFDFHAYPHRVISLEYIGIHPSAAYLRWLAKQKPYVMNLGPLSSLVKKAVVGIGGGYRGEFYADPDEEFPRATGFYVSRPKRHAVSMWGETIDDIFWELRDDFTIGKDGKFHHINPSSHTGIA